MSNKRITELPALTSLDNDDLLAVVDVSEKVTTKTTYGSLINNITGSIPPGLGATGLGWARYDDTAHVGSGSAFIVSASQTQVLPNNAGTIYDEHMHSTIAFYDSGSSKIQVENANDVYVATVTFKARTANANQTYFSVKLSSTGTTPYDRVRKDLYFPKGNDVEHYYHEVFQWYADADFVTNGNQFNISAFTNDVEVYDIIYFIQRTQNHGGE